MNHVFENPDNQHEKIRLIGREDLIRISMETKQEALAQYLSPEDALELGQAMVNWAKEAKK